jgi:hypothetical protein
MPLGLQKSARYLSLEHEAPDRHESFAYPFLREAGWEVVHWSTVGKADASDSEIMAFAATNNFVVLNHGSCKSSA